MENVTKPKRQRRAWNRKLFDEQNVLTLPYKRKQYQVWDGTNGRGSDPVQKGLSILVSPNGAKSYRSTFYLPGSAKPYSRHLGRVGEMTLADARKQCGIDRAEAKNGIDPRGDHTHSDAYAVLVKDYVKRVLIGAKANSSAGDTQRTLLKDVPDWEHRAVATITPPEIQKVLELVRDGDPEQNLKARPYQANKLNGALNTFFEWCTKPAIGKLKTSPMIGIDKPFGGETGRDRPWFKGSAADDAIKRLWNAADQLSGTEGRYLKTLLLTGKRKSAIANMKWEEIDDSWYWHAPKPAKAKTNKRLHPIPLPTLVQRILHPRKKIGYVFEGDDDGHIKVSGHELQDKIIEASGIADFLFHGTRHIAETKTAEIKIPAEFRDMVFDHAPKRGSGKIYDHHHYRDEMLDALETWAAHVEKLVKPEGVALLR